MSQPRAVQHVYAATATSDGAGVRLNRSIGGPDIDHLDPFLLLDNFQTDRAEDYIAGFPDHPHRGFETVTYMIEGRMRHRDNKGNEGLLRSGGVQWMTAGSGIVHSEMPEQEDGLMSGFQLWVNLPAAKKMTAPRYQDIDPEDVPEVTRDGGVKIRVVAGTLDGAIGPISGIASDPVYLDVALPAGSATTCTVPAGHTAFCFVFRGTAAIGGEATKVAAGHLAVLTPGDTIDLACDPAGGATDDARLILVAGAPIGEPIARHGPFVMNTREEIMQAVQDYNAGLF